MICALTVRTLKPGSFDQFREAFMEETPTRCPRASSASTCCATPKTPTNDLLRLLRRQRRGAARDDREKEGYDEQLERIAPFVESVGADGLYEIAEERIP